jgi:hypothetical protein
LRERYEKLKQGIDEVTSSFNDPNVRDFFPLNNNPKVTSSSSTGGPPCGTRRLQIGNITRDGGYFKKRQIITSAFMPAERS